MADSAEYPDGHFLGWTPGQVAPLLPKGLAWQLTPGTDLVVELHLQSSGKPERIQPSFGLFFTNDPPERTPSMLRLGSESIDIAAGAKDYTVIDSYELPVDAEIQAVQPHAHYRAREIKAVATLPDGTIRWLIYIKDWDFRWQHVFRYVKPFLLPRGTTISMRYTYDNSAENPRNPQVPPQRAMWGQRSIDEMGNLWIQVLTRDARDLGILNRSFRPKAAAADAAGYEMMLRREPTNVAYHNDAALLYLELGQPRQALAHFRTVSELQPHSAAAHFNLGTTLMDGGTLGEAIEHLQTALLLRPGYVVAHINLGNAFVTQGKLSDAVDQYREAVRIDSTNAVGRNDLGQVLLLMGDVEGAARHFREAIRLDAEYAEPHYNLGRVLRARGDIRHAIDELRRAIQLKPDWPSAQAELSQLLAKRH
jgi:tetratricopeptide (TPR) repeat protein